MVTFRYVLLLILEYYTIIKIYMLSYFEHLSNVDTVTRRRYRRSYKHDKNRFSIIHNYYHIILILLLKNCLVAASIVYVDASSSNITIIITYTIKCYKDSNNYSIKIKQYKCKNTLIHIPIYLPCSMWVLHLVFNFRSVLVRNKIMGWWCENRNYYSYPVHFIVGRHRSLRKRVNTNHRDPRTVQIVILSALSLRTGECGSQRISMAPPQCAARQNYNYIRVGQR